MKEEKVWRLDLGETSLFESAERRFQSGDYLGALTMLNKRAASFDPSADASALYADVYEALGLYPLAADAWFRFLDTCNEADFGEGYEGLAIAFMNMGNEFQSALYYRRAMSGEEGEGGEAFAFADAEEEPRPKPHLRLVHSSEGGVEDPETLSRGFAHLKAGELKEARETLLKISEESADYPSAAGIAAMCTLMMGDEARAEEECKTLLERYPENVQALTTYCAVLGARENKEGAREVALRLAAIPTDSTDDLYRIATALCETGLDEEAYGKLSILKERLPYDENVLYFHAAASCRTGRTEEAIASLELLTTVYPRKAVAQYYLERLRAGRDEGGDPVAMTYFYRMPPEEYNTIAQFLLAASESDPRSSARLGELKELQTFFRLAFDELEGRDGKLQLLAVKVAVLARADAFLREALLDYEGDEIVKLAILHALTARNEDNSFGVVICNLYKEFFTHKIEIGERGYEEFMKAFADVYSKFALLGEENEGKLCAAAEDVYHSLDEAEAYEFFDERAALAAAIYREARLRGGERGIGEICKLFDANRYTVQQILDYMM